MNNYCLISGENYLCKALALYSSLKKNATPFVLYYYCFDEITFININKLIHLNEKYHQLIPVSIKEVITERLEILRKERTQQEFYFTLTPFIISHCLENFKLDKCTYLDADVFFYNNPCVLFEEMQNYSALITKHNYSPKNEYLLYAGTYCVQFNPFKNDFNGIEILSWWKDRCEEWCFLKQEDGKWGDQGYLNQWPSKFSSVIVTKNLGAGVAPWNIENYKDFKFKEFRFTEIKSNLYFNLIFYHFQSIKRFFYIFYFIGNENFSDEIIIHLYKPYLKTLIKINKDLKKNKIGINPSGNSTSIKEIVFLLKKIIKGKVIIQI
jgi:hypothetical protein